MALIRFLSCTLALISTILSLWACASSSGLDLVVSESARGSVYLERFQDRSFQAAHPIKIGQATVARVLSGILVKEDQGLLRTLMAGQSAIVPAFTEKEVQYLAPLIAEGLSRAAPDQKIGFRLNQSGSGLSQSVGAGVGSSQSIGGLPVAETSRGTLYAYGRSLYLTLDEYHVRSERADTISMANRHIPDPTGLLNRTLSFSPESAQRPEGYKNKDSGVSTLVIDYELVATLPAAPLPLPSLAQPGKTSPSMDSDPPAPATDRQLRVLEEQMRQKNVELDELRKELQDIRRQLAEPSGSAGKPRTKSKASSDSH